MFYVKKSQIPKDFFFLWWASVYLFFYLFITATIFPRTAAMAKVDRQLVILGRAGEGQATRSGVDPSGEDKRTRNGGGRGKRYGRKGPGALTQRWKRERKGREERLRAERWHAPAGREGLGKMEKRMRYMGCCWSTSLTLQTVCVLCVCVCKLSCTSVCRSALETGTEWAVLYPPQAKLCFNCQAGSGQQERTQAAITAHAEPLANLPNLSGS